MRGCALRKVSLISAGKQNGTLPCQHSPASVTSIVYFIHSPSRIHPMLYPPVVAEISTPSVVRNAFLSRIIKEKVITNGGGGGGVIWPSTRCRSKHGRKVSVAVFILTQSGAHRSQNVPPRSTRESVSAKNGQSPTSNAEEVRSCLSVSLPRSDFKTDLWPVLEGRHIDRTHQPISPLRSWRTRHHCTRRRAHRSRTPLPRLYPGFQRRRRCKPRWRSVDQPELGSAPGFGLGPPVNQIWHLFG